MNKLLLLALVSAPAFAGDMPDSAITPGGIETTDEAIVCAPEYSKLARNVSESTKKFIYHSYGLDGGAHTGYCDEAHAGKRGCEVDHLVSIELGGTNEAKNLWIQPYRILDLTPGEVEWNAVMKDTLENRLHKMVCKEHSITLEEAQHAISTDWKAAYSKYITNGPTKHRK